MRHAGTAYLRTGAQWCAGWHWSGSSGTGGLETLREYVRRAAGGELRNLETVHAGAPDEYVTADVWVPVLP
jgi:hypothetical protein